MRTITAIPALIAIAVGLLEINKCVVGKEVEKLLQICDRYAQPCGSSRCYYPLKGEQCFTNDTQSYVCQYGQAMCGSSCYSPSEGKQCRWTSSGQAHVCSFGNELCLVEKQERCYDPFTNTCLNLDPSRKVLCQYGFLLCGQTCYNPKEKTCYDNRHLCKYGEELCGSTCYSPHLGEQCLQGPRSLQRCGIGQTALCDTTCYSPERGETCYHNRTTTKVCSYGQQQCPNSPTTCYSPELGQECYLTPIGVKVCGYNQRPCGHNCYNPSIGEQCYSEAS